MKKEKERNKNNSHAGTRTRVGEVKTRYPNRLDYMGPDINIRLSYFRATFNEKGFN